MTLLKSATGTRFILSVLFASLCFMPLLYSAKLTPDEELQRIVRKLIEVNQLDLPESIIEDSHIQKTDTLNAYTDGKKVVMTSALWTKLKTEDARAFVVGHELGHITNRHISKGTARKVGFSLLGRLLSLFISNPIGSYGAQIGTQLLDLKFDRNQEYQADDSGMLYMMTANYNKNAAIDVFKVLRQASQGGRVEFLVTHPLPDSRIKRVSEKYNLQSI